MMTRWPIVAALLCVQALASCEDRRPAVVQRASTRAATDRSAESQRRIPLVAIPFTAVVPDGWDVRAGPGGQLTLDGPTPDGGEVDILLSVAKPIRADTLPAMIERFAPTTARSAPEVDAGVLTRRIGDRDGLQIVDETERLGPADQAADLAPFRWTVRYIVVVDDALAYPVYEMNVAGLSQAAYERSQAFVRAILESVQYDAGAARAAP